MLILKQKISNLWKSSSFDWIREDTQKKLIWTLTRSSRSYIEWSIVYAIKKHKKIPFIIYPKIDYKEDGTIVMSWRMDNRVTIREPIVWKRRWAEQGDIKKNNELLTKPEHIWDYIKVEWKSYEEIAKALIGIYVEKLKKTNE